MKNPVTQVQEDLRAVPINRQALGAIVPICSRLVLVTFHIESDVRHVSAFVYTPFG